MNSHRKADLLYKEYEDLEKKGDRECAIKKLESAASLGAVYAQYTLAYEYYNSNLPRIKKAINLYKIAVSKGDFLSAWNLARHYEKVRNVRWYRYWLNKASDMGMLEAVAELNRPFPYIIQDGQNALKNGNLVLAAECYEFAARNGSEEASKELEKLGLR